MDLSFPLLFSRELATPVSSVLNCGGRLYNEVANRLSLIAAENKGKYGYGIFGGVIGCTEKEHAAEIRQANPNLFFLIPGYGAQGGGAADVLPLLREGNGGVVNASRSILTAWKQASGSENANNEFAAAAARKAVITMRDEIRK